MKWEDYKGTSPSIYIINPRAYGNEGSADYNLWSNRHPRINEFFPTLEAAKLAAEFLLPQ